MSYTLNDSRAEGSLITKVEGFEYSSVLDSVEDIPNDGGAFFVNTKFGSRRVGVTALIRCDRIDERNDLLAALRQTGHLKKVTFTTQDNRNLQFYALVKNLVFPYTTLETPLFLDMIAPDYRFYSQTEHTNNSGASPQTINNAGNEITHPVFRIFGPMSEVTIENLASSREFTVTYALAEGDYIDIDITNKTVILNDTTPIFSAFEGDFFGLEPGDNVLNVTFTDGDTPSALTTTWRDAWNGI